MTTAAALAALFNLRADQCHWPSRHDLDDPRMTWCSQPALPGKSYCPKHQRLAYGAEDTAALDDVVDDGNRTYRVERQAGRSLGDQRIWKVVPVAGSAPARGSPDSASVSAASRAASDEDAHHEAAQRPTR
jgi:hypothetical protein